MLNSSRAHRLPAARLRPGAHLLFTVGGERCLLSMSGVREVVLPTRLIKGGDADMSGQRFGIGAIEHGVRGAVPVVDLATALRAIALWSEAQARVIVWGLEDPAGAGGGPWGEGGVVGLLVDRVLEVVHVGAGDVRPARPLDTQIDLGLTDGVCVTHAAGAAVVINAGAFASLLLSAPSPKFPVKVAG